MKRAENLPEGYREIFSVDLQQDKKLAIGINVAAALVVVALGVGMHFLVPITALFSMERGLGPYLLRFGVLLVAYVAYIVLHEAVHGIAMRMCGTKKVRFGFTGLYAFAGSDDYYGKKSYIFIALAPVVLWGIVLGVLCLLLPREWFWVAWLVQVTNLSGAAGDIYVTCKFARMPADILVRDRGVGMTVFSATEL